MKNSDLSLRKKIKHFEKNMHLNNDLEEKRYTLFIWFIDGYDEEKTFEFITGQNNVRSFVIENADIIDFDKSLISSWKEPPEGENGFILLYDFMHYLDNLSIKNNFNTNEKVYDDGFNIETFLSSQEQLIQFGEEESKNFMNDIKLSHNNTKMIDINNIEKGEDI